MSNAEQRPGSTYFVPAVRVMNLDKLDARGSAGEEIESLRKDIVKVEVTRVNTGSCQYSITLNNWYDTLPADRSAGKGSAEVLRGAQPLWPRFKYNDFSILNFGNRVRIEMRYWPDPVEQPVEDDSSAQRWIPMVEGPITDMKFSFGSTEGARLTITGEDDLRVLKTKSDEKKDYKGKNEEEIVKDVLQRANFPLQLAQPLVARPAFFTNPANDLAEAHEKGQSYLEFLQRFAERYDLEIFIEYADVNDPASALEFHMEPARSRTPPDKTLRDIYVLQRGMNLVDFTPTLKVLDQYTSVTTAGRHRVRSRPQKVEEPADASILDDELHRDVGRGDPPLVAGPDVRQRIYGAIYGENPFTMNNETNIDEERGREMACAALRKQARQFLTITASTIGLPRLRAGRHVEIFGMRPPFDGFYYVTQAQYTFGDGGLRTSVSARRPGMPMPPYGEA